MSLTRRDLPPNFFSLEWGGVEPPHELMFAPARTVLPMLRYPLGYSMVHPLRMLPVTLFMIAVPPFAWGIYGIFVAGSGRHIPADTGHIYLIGFALLSFVAATAVFMRRWLGLRRGEKIHQAETGYSWLAYHTNLPVPLCEMLVVPLVIGALGWIIDDTFSINLGRWLILSGCSLFGLAFWERRRVWSQRRSAIDEEQRVVAYERGFSRQEQKKPTNAPDIAELARGLRGRKPGIAATSDEQRRDVGAPGRSGDPASQKVDDALF